MFDIIIVSGASGSGKTTLANELVARRKDEFEIIKSVTTREPRNSDDYYTFVSEDEFLQMENEGKFLETNKYLGNNHWYGTPLSEVERVLSLGKTPILDIDVNGRRQVTDNLKNLKYRILSLFIVVPPEEVYNRLRKRGESKEMAIQRMEASLDEIAKSKSYDRHIVNLNVESAVHDLNCVIENTEPTNSVCLDEYLQNTFEFLQRMHKHNIF